MAIAAISVLGISAEDATQPTYVQPAPSPIYMDDMVETSTQFETVKTKSDRSWINEPEYLPTSMSLKRIYSNGEVIYAIYGSDSFEVRPTMIENIRDGVVITYSTDDSFSPDWVELAKEKTKEYDHINISTIDGISVKLVEDIRSDDIYSVNKAFHRDGKNIVIVLSKTASIDELEKIIRSII